EGGGYGFAERDGIEIHLGVVAAGDHRTNGAYLFVDDADDVAEKWRSAGAEVHGPEDTEWGQHEGAMVDPDGNVIRFGSPLRRRLRAPPASRPPGASASTGGTPAPGRAAPTPTSTGPCRNRSSWFRAGWSSTTESSGSTPAPAPSPNGRPAAPTATRSGPPSASATTTTSWRRCERSRIGLRELGHAAGDRLGPALGRLGLVVLVVPPPPGVGVGLGVTGRRVLPRLLAPEGGHVEVVPGVLEHLVAPVVDEVRPEDAFAVADEGVRAVPLPDVEVRVEVVGDRVPRHLPVHPGLEPLDLGLRRPGGEHQRGVAGVQMGQVGDVVGDHGAAAAGVVRPAGHVGIEEGPVDDQLPPSGEELGQAELARRP